MTTRAFILLLVFAYQTLAKPLEVLQNPQPLNPLQQTEVSTVVDNERGQRSPQFGFLDGDFSDPDSDFVEEERHFKHHHRKHHHKPGYGEYPQYGGYPSPVVYPQPVAPVQSGGSFATASAGSTGYGGQSQANAQSATLNFGPFSASFSTAEASAGGIRY
ncbi:histone-lysine N-methyltransferase Suv4-20-like [Ceratina calcarata]|uniref:Histone-lysine N-methyltransferase Suv4-20-like n=1 Tax=Ceratina calcarata TaxID=156304 RepID=A0AAJ7IZU5_9HYME|nr:histone-lysine N-methyltransferase Suv4-20-like [Ceratina calcarata]